MRTKTARKIFPRFALLSVSVLTIFAMTACNSTDQASTNNKKNTTNTSVAPQTGGTITVGLSQEPDTLDIQKTAMSTADEISNRLGNTLLTLDPKTNEIAPGLAESYQVSNDGKTITFKIRQGVTFHDGSPLTSKSFKETFDRMLNPATGAPLVSFLAGVKSVLTPDDQTLVVDLEQPSAPFLNNLTTGFLQPLSVSAINKDGANYGRNPVGVGPWKFEKWTTGQSVTLDRNNDYNWAPSFFANKGKAYPDKLVYKFITDPQTMLAALDSGSIDVLVNAAPKDAERYRKNDKFQVLDADQQGLGLFLEMNLDNELLKDKNVRTALNMAINKDAIIKAALNGEGTAAYGPLSSSIFGYDSNVKEYGIKYNKDEAIKLLESSGWSKNSQGIMEKNGKKLEFDLSVYSTQSQAAQIVQAMLKDIGVNINIKQMETATLIQKASKGEFDLSFLSYSYSDPDILYMLFHSSQIGGLNHIRVKNPELDALLEKGRTTTNAEERKQIYADAQKLIVENAYWVPIYSPKVFYIVNNRVHDIKLQSTNILLNDSWVSK
ncbi:ABC transporter substrate-binding protein [Gottfriedia acidiceleris]|uniref:ABC transporter substrate-binding protein n=1 Tax=Gottfriedia acidiceleris TaxID=371036 RepID=UPI003000BC6E